MRGREQGSGNREQPRGDGLRIVESRSCTGCGRPCGEAKRCRKCTLEVLALNKMYDEEAMTEEEREAALHPGWGFGVAAPTPAVDAYRERMKLGDLLPWLPLLIPLGVALGYLGWVCGEALLAWIASGGPWQ